MKYKPDKSSCQVTEHDKIIKKHLQTIKSEPIYKSKYDKLFTKILAKTRDLWFPSSDKNNQNIIQENVNSSSWFDIIEYRSIETNKNFEANFTVETADNIVKCQKIKMYPNKLQKELLLNWMHSYIKMYNETLKVIKKNAFDNTSLTLNWKKLRTNYMKKIKENILKKSNITIGHVNKTQVNGHVLDFAIQDACSKLKSCISNLKNNNIKKFRMRYLKLTKDSMIIKIEKAFISPTKNTFCSSIFKDEFKFSEDFDLKSIDSDFTIHYNRKLDEFYLLNPIKSKSTIEKVNKTSVGIDPGIRTFLTTFSDNKCTKIGTNLQKKIIKYLKKIDKLNDSNCTKKEIIRKKLEGKFYKKIKDIVDDLHWKAINYLTSNYGNILIGNMSTKGIISNESNSKLSVYNKRIASFMSLFRFRERLAYKCLSKGIGYSVIDESYTTKTCTKCCYQNDVGRKEHIKCSFCRLSIERDISGARNILLVGTN